MFNCRHACAVFAHVRTPNVTILCARPFHECLTFCGSNIDSRFSFPPPFFFSFFWSSSGRGGKKLDDDKSYIEWWKRDIITFRANSGVKKCWWNMICKNQLLTRIIDKNHLGFLDFFNSLYSRRVLQSSWLKQWNFLYCSMIDQNIDNSSDFMWNMLYRETNIIGNNTFTSSVIIAKSDQVVYCWSSSAITLVRD